MQTAGPRSPSDPPLAPLASPLLYLPGLDGTARLLHRQPALHAAYAVVPNPYPQLDPRTYEQLADEAAGRFAAALAAAGRAAGPVLAESFGGAVALTLALRHPGLVERLVLVNTFAYFPRRRLLALAALASRSFPATPPPEHTRPLRELVFFSPEVRARESRVWWERVGDVPMCGYGYRVRLIAGLDLRPRLREVAAPAVVVAAPDDRLVPPAAGRELARGLPRARLVRPRVGHCGLVHPRLDAARLLADPRLWPP